MKIGKLNNQFVLLLFFVVFIVACKKNISNPAPPDPLACFSASTNFQKANTLINFTNCSENFDLVEWNFDDGSSSTLANPSHQYSVNGTYNVTLKVSKNNKSSTLSRKIAIANQVQIDFTVLMKNFKDAVTSNSFTCKYAAINSKNKEQLFFNLTYPAINNPNYTISTDMTGLYFGNDPNVKHRFKVICKNNSGVIDSLITEEIDIVESASIINNTAKLNFADANYAITLSYQ